MFNSRTVPHTHSQRISTPLASTFIRRVISTGPLSAFKSSRMHRSPSSALYSTHIRHALNSPISGRNPGGELTDPITRRYSAVFRRQPRSRVQDARVFFFMAKVFRFSCFRFVDLSVLSCLFLWLAFCGCIRLLLFVVLSGCFSFACDFSSVHLVTAYSVESAMV